MSVENIKEDIIYKRIIDEVNGLISSLQEPNGAKDEEFTEYRNESIRKLGLLKEDLNDSIRSLEKNSEWDTFTIAFYGETNAGKSTLIEALRIYFEEASKVEERTKYKETEQLYNEKRRILNNIVDETNNLKIQRDESDKHYLEILEELIGRINDNADEILEKQLRILFLKDLISKSMYKNIFGFLKVQFNSLEEQKELSKINLELVELSKENESLTNSLEEVKAEIHRTYNDLSVHNSDLHENINILNTQIQDFEKELEFYSDGKIIDAHSDFTKEVQSYHFNFHGHIFNILDLPGIEGKEELVQDEIQKAIERAHVVFYVSKAPRSPQKNDNASGGTIGKIKSHLSQQAEVYFLFNKPIPGVRQIEQELVTADIEKGLQEVDSNMKEALGDNYSGHFILSAYPAFIAKANAFSGKYQKAKLKFLDKYTEEEIIQKSNIYDFCNWIFSDLLDEVQKKIVYSNFKKIKYSIMNLERNVFELKNRITTLSSKVSVDLNNVKKRLNKNKDTLKRNIVATIDQLIDEYKNECRKDIYKEIDKDINNSVLKSKMEIILDKKKADLEYKIQNELDKLSKEVKEDIESIVERYLKYYYQLLELSEQELDFKFDFPLDIKAKSKGRVWKLLVEVSLFITACIETEGWALVFSVIAGIIAIVKEVYAFFDSEYKKGQQRESVDKNLDSICSLIKDTINDGNKETLSRIDETYIAIENELSKSLSQIDAMLTVFDTSYKKIKLMEKNVELEERKYYEHY